MQITAEDQQPQVNTKLVEWMWHIAQRNVWNLHFERVKTQIWKNSHSSQCWSWTDNHWLIFECRFISYYNKIFPLWLKISEISTNTKNKQNNQSKQNTNLDGAQSLCQISSSDKSVLIGTFPLSQPAILTNSWSLLLEWQITATIHQLQVNFSGLVQTLLSHCFWSLPHPNSAAVLTSDNKWFQSHHLRCHWCSQILTRTTAHIQPSICHTTPIVSCFLTSLRPF